MAGFTVDPGATPNRRTHIVLDPPEYSQLEPPFSMIREMEEIAAGEASIVDSVRLSHGGWQLDAVQDDLGSARQSISGQDGLFTLGNGKLLAAAKFTETDTWRKQAGVTYGADTADTGDPYIQKQAAAGDDLDSTSFRLSADETAFPGPATLLDLSPVDRVAMTVENDTDETKVWRIKVVHNASTPETYSAVFYFMFNGPANTKPGFVGFGQYTLLAFGDGVGWLLERGEVWTKGQGGDPDTKVVGTRLHRKFRLWSAGQTQSRIHIVEVQTFKAGVYRRFPHGAVEVRTIGGAQSEKRGATGGLTSFAATKGGNGVVAANAGTVATVLYCSKAPHGYETLEVPGRVKPTQARIGNARDVRLSNQLGRHTYVLEGTLQDDPFDLDFWPVATNAIKVNYWGEQPAGTSITVELFDSETGLVLTPTVTTDWSASFATVVDSRFYHARFTLSSDDGERTPTLVGYQAVRDGTQLLVEPGETEVDNLASNLLGVITAPRSLGSKVSIVQAEADLSVNTASFAVDDLVGILPKLQTRGLIGVRIETAYDPTDPDARSVLFRGRVVAPRGIRKGRGSGHYGARWRRYDLDAVGFWQRLSEALSTVRFNFSDADPDDLLGRPYKVTTAVRTVLGWIGLPPEMIDVPDLPLRFWPNASNDAQVDPLANLGDVVTLWVRHWLGMRLVWDDNAGPYGVARVRYANRAPYSYFCHFVTTSQGAGKVVHMPASYGLDPGDGRPIVPIRAGTLTTWKRPLEFNKLVLTTTGLIAGRDDSRFRTTQVFYNYKSYNFANLPGGHAKLPDPEHPDYWPGVIPAYVVDPTLGGDSEETEQVVNWFGRRMMAIGGCTKAGLKFQAAIPLDFEDDDDLSTIPRPPMYYDAVTVDGVDFLVRTCNPEYAKDSFMWGNFELEAPREDFL